MRTTSIIDHSSALIESGRCLGCHDSPCTAACPVNMDIPGFIQRLQEENPTGAGELVYSANPLAATCGLACPTEELCEGACTMLQMGQTSVRIGSLQTYAATIYNQKDACETSPTHYRVAVIGGGPSGLGCAAQLKRYGYDIDIYEKEDSLGGLIDRVIPEYRLPHETVIHDLERLIDSGINLHLNTKINQENAKGILNDYNAVFIGTGLSNIRLFSKNGEELKIEGVSSAMDYLDDVRCADIKNENPPDLGQQVIIVGGGNVALDAAVMAKRHGADRVIVLYRRSNEEMPGWESEYLEAARLGVEFRWLSTIKEFVVADNKLFSIDVETMRFSRTSSNGRRRVEPAADIPIYNLKCDSVVLALGQFLDNAILDHFDLPQPEFGQIPINTNYQTENPKIFAGGEVANGGGTIVSSLSQGMTAGKSIHEWLQNSTTSHN
jgi:glutamate synthase (NADPH) small chain